MRIRKELANTLRILAVDAVEAAKSGHPGAPMGMADMAEALWRGSLKHNPNNPDWVNRDRFILSNGHASMLLYGLLHLTGYPLSMDDLRAFRQFGSRTPGHPEWGVTPGVETTTGPLGQGLAEAVGMALAERLLAAEFNRDGFPVIDHFTYVFAGDGCLMEGISQEACSLAGTLGLGKLIVLYDSNGISIDGSVSDWFADDTAMRFEACGWHVVRDVDGHDGETLDAALTLARNVAGKPSLICCRTVIGYGSPNKSASASCHGSPLGAEETALTRVMLGWESAPFEVPADIREAWDCRTKGAAAEAAWQTLYADYTEAHPELAARLEGRLAGILPAGWDEALGALMTRWNDEKPKLATRIACKDTLSAIVPHVPALFGGSADLSGSVGTQHKQVEAVRPGHLRGNYLSYGVREFLMAAMMNGMALHGGFIPYGGTFLVFSDYARNAIRLSALMRQRVVYVLTHDSIGLGEDGPTHQAVEQVPSLRLIPNLAVWRPADSVETVAAWHAALANAHTPTCLVLSRQNLTTQPRTAEQLGAMSRGGYILRDCAGEPEALLLATGSEVELAVAAAVALEAKGRRVRVVSMPCTEAFDAQDAAYRNAVLPPAVRARVAVEAAQSDGWYKYVGLDGAVVGMTTFGESAPAEQLFAHFGFTVDRVAATVETLLG